MLYAIKRYLAIHINGVRHLINRLLGRVPSGRLFALVFNLIALVTLKPTRLVWGVGEGHYILRDRSMPNQPLKVHASGHNSLLGMYIHGLAYGIDDMRTRRMLDNIKFAKGDVVLDCGAHLGLLKLYCDGLGKGVTYIGFEPDPQVYPCLAQNIAPSTNKTKTKGEAHNIGLWDKAGELKFYVAARELDSSFIKPPKYDSVTKVATRPLRDFITGRVKLLKLEAEGGELEVLHGAGDKIKMVEYISADLGAERGVNEEYTLIPVTNFLIKHGFEVKDFWVAGSKYINVLFHNTRRA